MIRDRVVARVGPSGGPQVLVTIMKKPALLVGIRIESDEGNGLVLPLAQVKPLVIALQRARCVLEEPSERQLDLERGRVRDRLCRVHPPG